MLRIFTHYVKKQGTLRRMARSASEAAAPITRDIDALFAMTERFWGVLYEQRANLFQAHVMDSRIHVLDDETTFALGDVLALCLLVIDDMWADLGRYVKHDPHRWASMAMLIIASRSSAGNRLSIFAHFLSWIYLPHEHPFSQPIFEQCYEDIFGVTSYAEVPAWFREALIRPQQVVDCISSFRGGLLSRKVDAKMHAALLDILEALMQNPHFEPGLRPFSRGTDNPISWSMKVMQRQLCMRGASLAHEIVPLAFSCMA